MSDKAIIEGYLLLFKSSSEYYVQNELAKLKESNPKLYQQLLKALSK